MTKRMKFGLRIPLCAPPQQVAEAVARAEEGGFDIAWLPDSQCIWRDLWVNMGVSGARGSRITLGTCVTNPVTRHAAVTASAAASVDELTGGRVILGIGSGDSSVRVMGWETARLATLRDYIGIVRSLLERKEIAPYGRSFHLTGATGRSIPIYVAATGPKMLQLAGELGDGVILLSGVAKESIEFALTNLEIGARRAGRRLEEIDVVTGAFCEISRDWRRVRDLARPYAAKWALKHKETLRASGLSVPETLDVSGLYPDLTHAEDWDLAIQKTSWVPDEMVEGFCEKFCLMGSADEVANKIRTLASWGVTNLYIRWFYSYRLPLALCDIFAKELIPQFR
jgi:5,10-methylenetetrahydromethanopterin reductase